MFCTKCGREIRIAPGQVGVDKNNMPIYHRFGYCDTCKLKWDLDATKGEYKDVTKKQHSTLSCVACVLTGIAVLMIMSYVDLLGILGIVLAFVGMILGLIDLCMWNKKKKHIGSWFALVVFAVCLIIMIL